MSWTRALVAAVAAVSAALSIGTPVSVASDEHGAFSARPSPNAPQDERGTFFRLHVERGTDRRQSVVIDNLSKQRKHLLLDAVDGETGTTSGSVYPNRDDPRTKAGSMIDLPRKSVNLPPGTAVRVPFSLNVPKEARPGDHLAGISIQDAHRTHSKSRLSVTQIIVVVGVQIIVDGPKEKALTLGKVEMKALPGTKVPSVVVHMENTGTELCAPLLDVNLTSPDGKQQLVSRQLDTVLPATAIDFPMPWPKALESGSYEVGVTAKQCGEPQAVQVSATLGAALLGTPDAPEPKAPTVIVQKTPIPWVAMVGLIVLVAVLTATTMGFFLTRRRPTSSP